TPAVLAPGSAVRVHFWRLTDSRRVWYEWACDVSPPPSPLAAPATAAAASLPQTAVVSPLHNPAGRSSFIGL
ncbi:hypothetical protein HK405_000526, partial [Cladochytrium tenue]